MARRKARKTRKARRNAPPKRRSVVSLATLLGRKPMRRRNPKAKAAPKAAAVKRTAVKAAKTAAKAEVKKEVAAVVKQTVKQMAKAAPKPRKAPAKRAGSKRTRKPKNMALAAAMAPVLKFKAGKKGPMPAWNRKPPARPKAHIPGLAGYRHLVSLDPWRGNVKRRSAPGWYWTPETETSSSRFAYRKNSKKRRHGRKSALARRRDRFGHFLASNPGRRSRKGRKARRHARRHSNPGMITKFVKSVKKFLGIRSGKSRKGRRSNPEAVVVTAKEIGFNALAGTGAFITGRLIANLAKRVRYLAPYRQYVPVAGSLANCVAMHMASKRVPALKPYRTALLTGAGIQLVETLIDTWAPTGTVHNLLTNPGGLGADLNVYEAALQDDLGEYVGLDGMGEYVGLEGNAGTRDLGEYMLEEEAAEEDGGYTTDELAEYELSDEVLADEVLADEVLADDLGDDLGDLGAEAAPPPPPTAVISTPAAGATAVSIEQLKAMKAAGARMGRGRPARRAARIASVSGHPAGILGAVVSTTPTGGIFGEMAVAPSRRGGRRMVRKPGGIRRDSFGNPILVVPTTKRALTTAKIRSIYAKPTFPTEQGIFHGDIFSADRI